MGLFGGYKFTDREELRKAVVYWLYDNKEYRKKYGKYYTHYGDISTWDVSAITDMSNLFFSGIRELGANQKFKGIEKWDVSNVKNMSRMFKDCPTFNLDLSKWDVSNVEDMSFMFMGCKNFNQNINSWARVGGGKGLLKVKTMRGMFRDCESFNQDVHWWDTRNVEDMGFMFCGCKNFNSFLFNRTENVKDMSFMFYGCESFNKSQMNTEYIDETRTNWSVANVTNFESMFQNAKSFDQLLCYWDIRNGRNFKKMFKNAVKVSVEKVFNCKGYRLRHGEPGKYWVISADVGPDAVDEMFAGVDPGKLDYTNPVINKMFQNIPELKMKAFGTGPIEASAPMMSMDEYVEHLESELSQVKGQTRAPTEVVESEDIKLTMPAEEAPGVSAWSMMQGEPTMHTYGEPSRKTALPPVRLPPIRLPPVRQTVVQEKEDFGMAPESIMMEPVEPTSRRTFVLPPILQTRRNTSYMALPTAPTGELYNMPEAPTGDVLDRITSSFTSKKATALGGRRRGRRTKRRHAKRTAKRVRGGKRRATRHRRRSV